MTVFLNGELVPDNEAKVSVFDRSFQYGDGLFETIRISNGRPFRWAQHLERLASGSHRLSIKIPYDSAQLFDAVAALTRVNEAPEAVLRIALSRGVGRRGYSPKGANQPLMVMSLHPADVLPPLPRQWKLSMSSLRLAEDCPLAHLKTSNKLLQILARAEAEQSNCDEALLLNTRGEVCETSSGNLFWIEGSRLHTPPADAGLLLGVTRAVMMELAPTLGLTVVESRAQPAALNRSNGAFVTLSSVGIVEITRLDDSVLQTSTHTRSLYQGYRRLLSEETEDRP